jgi:hypothetical protein
MRAVIYPPPESGLPFVAIVFHTDGSVALAKPFSVRDGAERYLADLTSSLVAIDDSVSDG